MSVLIKAYKETPRRTWLKDVESNFSSGLKLGVTMSIQYKFHSIMLNRLPFIG